MRPPEEELPVEVAGLNGVKVDLLQHKVNLEDDMLKHQKKHVLCTACAG